MCATILTSGTFCALLILLGLGPSSAQRLDNVHTLSYGFKGKFVVIGATGSGKTTLIQSLIHNDVKFQKSSIFKASANNVTLEIESFSSPRFKLKDVKAADGSETEVQVDFLDTVGVDADKQVPDVLFKELTHKILRHAQEVNGFILVHKMDRFRQGYGDNMQRFLHMFKEFEVDEKHILVVVTHSSLFKLSVKKRYNDELCEKFSWLKDCGERILHTNFVNFKEIKQELHSYYEKEWVEGHTLLMSKLITFTNPFSPMTYLLNKNEKMSGLRAALSILKKITNNKLTAKLFGAALFSTLWLTPIVIANNEEAKKEKLYTWMISFLMAFGFLLAAAAFHYVYDALGIYELADMGRDFICRLFWSEDESIFEL